MRQLTEENIESLPTNTIIMYNDSIDIHFGYLSKNNDEWWFKSFEGFNSDYRLISNDIVFWQIFRWRAYSIISKEEYVLWKLENL